MRKLIVPCLTCLFLTGCLGDEIGQLDDDISFEQEDVDIEIPEVFTIDIPDELSSYSSSSSSKISDDEFISISGDDVFGELRRFIKVGESAAEIVEKIMDIARTTSITELDSFDIVSNDDGRLKYFSFARSVTYEGVLYENEMTVNDENGSMAIQVVWNTDPIDGVATLNPYYVDRNTPLDYLDTHYSVAYSEDNSRQEMIVTIDGVQVEEGGLNKLKMGVTKEDDIIEVYGNSNNPDFAVEELIAVQSRNYAFRARADESQEIAVAEIALPPSSVETNNVMEDYSIYNVFDQAIREAGLDNQALIDLILVNMQAPGYFREDIFLGAGYVPEVLGFTEEFSDLTGMQPFVPREVANLSISFLE